MEFKKLIKLIVDTDQYSGNFEREMCAWVTGQIGECGAGIEEAEEQKELIVHLNWWEENIYDVPDEHSTYRPCAIEITPGYFNNGSGLHFIDTPENRVIGKQKAIENTIAYHENTKNFCKQALKDNIFPQNWSKEGCERTLKNIETSIENVKTRGDVYPSYQSVAIFVDEMPPNDVYEEFKARCVLFCEKEVIQLLGFRIE